MFTQEILDTLSVASDFSYACHLWKHEHFMRIIQNIVRLAPVNLEKIGSLLMKMRSVLRGTPESNEDPQPRTHRFRVSSSAPEKVCDV